MFDELESKHQKILLTVFYAALFCLLLYLFFHYLLGWFAPFILAYIFALIAEPVVKFLMKKFHVGRKIAAVLSILICLGFIYILFYLLINRAIYELGKISSSLPSLISSIPSSFDGLWNSISDSLSHLHLSIEIRDHIGNILSPVFEKIPETLSSYLQGITLDFATGLGNSLPNFFIFIIAFLVASFFIISDRQKISAFLLAQLPTTWKKRMTDIKGHLLLTFVKYLKALFILLTITFIELLIGFSIIKIDYALTLAFVIAIIDAIPILGTGTVLIPWGIVCLIQGNYRLGISLLVLYAIVAVVRQMIEPKVVGSSIGLYPLATLISIYVGYKILGVVGMFVGPFICILLKFLQENQILSLYKTPPPGEEKNEKK